MIVDAWLMRAAAARPDVAAVETPEGSVTYAELHARAVGVAGSLHALGVGTGDRVAIALPPGLAFAETLHAVLALGAVAVPIDPRLTEDERTARTAGAATLVVERPLEPEDAVLLSPTHDLAAIALGMHTSGTTAAPRPVDLTYGNVLWSATGSAAALGLDPNERWLCPLPVSHVGGLSILLRSAIHATTAVLHPRFEAEAVRDALMEERITLVSLVPTMLARLLDAGLDHPPALRCALLGGGPAAPALLERAAGAGVPVAQTYGLTEACSQVTTSAPGDPATAGAPLLPTRVRIDAEGEVLVAGPTIAPAALASDGWLHTGDLGSLDDRRRLTITGRKADTIVSGGENVAPAEVEAALLAHAAVADAGVHGRHDAEWGEAVVATVVLRSGTTATVEELRAHCAERLARFKVPKEIAFAAELPRTPSGKLLRRELAPE